MARFCIGCKNDWCLSADGTSHDTGSSVVACTAWPHDEAPECPCGGWDCSALPGGSMQGCPYPAATNGLTHFVPRTEEIADALESIAGAAEVGKSQTAQTAKASVLKNRDGEASARTAAPGKDRARILPETVEECHVVIQSLHDDFERACRHIDEISAGASGALAGEGNG